MSKTKVDLSQIKVTPSTFLPKEVRKTTKDHKPGGKGLDGTYTSKDKEVLGVPDDNVITWVPFHMSSSDNNLFKVFSKNVVGRPSYELVCDIFTQWFNENRDVITESTTEFMKEEKTVEEIEKNIEKMRLQMEKSIQLLKSMKG